jgi:hypothetical protein
VTRQSDLDDLVQANWSIANRDDHPATKSEQP